MARYRPAATFELSTVEQSSGDSRFYRLGLLRSVQKPQTYCGKVCPSDWYNHTPTFCSEAYKGFPASVSMFVEDASDNWDELRGDHPDELIDAVISRLEAVVREGGD